MVDLPTFELTAEGVTAALADLDKGGSEDVAIRLQELDFKGQRDNDCDSPEARYLFAVLPDAEYVQVGSGDVFIKGVVYEDVGNGFMQPWDVQFHVDLPDSVAAFVEDFDAGIYPELIDSTEEEVSHG